MKRLLFIVLTMLVLIGLTYGVTYFTSATFIDYSFIVGLAASVFIWFFTSKGGVTSRNLDMNVQGSTGIKLEKQKHEFSPNAAFITSLAYTLISFVILLIYYRSYFF